MGFLNKCMNTLGFGSEYEEDEEEIIDEIDTEEDEEVKSARSGYFGRRSYAKETNSSNQVSSNTKIIPMVSTASASKMVITQPVCFDDVKEIGEHLKEKKSVIVNLETVNKEDHRRIVDFISGATYVLDGSIQKISTLIYLVTPKTIEIQNDIERAQYRNKLPFTWMK